MERARPGITRPRKHQLAGAPGTNHLVVNEVRRESTQREIAPALPDDLVSRGKANEVSEPLDHDGVAIMDVPGDRVVHGYDLGVHRSSLEPEDERALILAGCRCLGYGTSRFMRGKCGDQQPARTREMLFEQARGGFDVAPFQSVEERVVLPLKLVPILEHQAVGEPVPIHPAQEAGNHLTELRSSVQPVNQLMKLDIERAPGSRVPSLLCLRQYGPSPLELGPAQLRHGLPDCRSLQNRAYLVDLRDLGGAKRGHRGAAIGLVVYQALGLQLTERLPNRDMAYPELIGDLVLREWLIGLEVSRRDGFTQDRSNELMAGPSPA